MGIVGICGIVGLCTCTAQPSLEVLIKVNMWFKPLFGVPTNHPVALSKAITQVADPWIPIFFSTFDFDPDQLPGLRSKKAQCDLKREDTSLFDLDPRLGRLPNEKIFTKRAASCFKGTDLQNMLTTLGVDTLIVTGVSTSHCVYATCRDACDAFRVIIPREAVGERCQIMHMVNLLDLDIDIGDVLPAVEVRAYLDNLPPD